MLTAWKLVLSPASLSDPASKPVVNELNPKVESVGEESTSVVLGEEERDPVSLFTKIYLYLVQDKRQVLNNRDMKVQLPVQQV